MCRSVICWIPPHTTGRVGEDATCCQAFVGQKDWGVHNNGKPNSTCQEQEWEPHFYFYFWPWCHLQYKMLVVIHQWVAVHHKKKPILIKGFFQRFWSHNWQPLAQAFFLIFVSIITPWRVISSPHQFRATHLLYIRQWKIVSGVTYYSDYKWIHWRCLESIQGPSCYHIYYVCIAAASKGTVLTWKSHWSNAISLLFITFWKYSGRLYNVYLSMWRQIHKTTAEVLH